MKFERGKDPKETMGIGIKEGEGYNIFNIVDENIILPGINSENTYLITHIGSRSVSGFCSGQKVMKVLISLMVNDYICNHLNDYKDYQCKWIWNPIGSMGGNLTFYYSLDGKDWIDSNNTKGYNFSKLVENTIMEL